MRRKAVVEQNQNSPSGKAVTGQCIGNRASIISNALDRKQTVAVLHPGYTHRLELTSTRLRLKPVSYSLKTRISTPRHLETRAFYETVFGMTVVEAWSEPGDVGAILAFPGGRQEAFLEVYHVDDQQAFDGLSLQFRVDSIAAFVDSLSGEIKFEGPTDRPWGSKYLYLRDPNDIQVIVYEGGL